MDSNTYSSRPRRTPEWLARSEPPEPPERLQWLERSEPSEPSQLPEPLEWSGPLEGLEDVAELTAALDKVATRDLDRLPVLVRSERVRALHQVTNRLHGQWLNELAGIDALGAAGADQAAPAPSTAGWLRNGLRMGVGAARNSVRTARALFRGPLKETAAALTAGDISPAHATVIAEGTHDLPPHIAMDADPVLAHAARRLDPTQLRRLVAQLIEVADRNSADAAHERRHERRGLWLSPTWRGMVAVNGLLDREAGHLVQTALEPLARPSEAGDDRKGSQRNADALTELCRRALEGGQLPKSGGVRPQLLITVDLNTLLGRPGALGGETEWAGPLSPEACRRLACDAAVTRVLVTRQPDHAMLDHGYGAGHGPGIDPVPAADPDPGPPLGLQGRLRAAKALLPPALGGAPRQPLDLGRSTRVISPAQRSALAVRDGGCVFPGCDRPLAWCDGHHLASWLDGGPTDLANLALLCRAHHRTVHEGGWQLTRGPDGRFTAIPPQRRHHAA
jgi:hypothetical protein